jgi:CBS domain-containing protein
MDTELDEIRDFLAQHAPFDTLPKPVLDRLVPQLQVRYFRRGSVLLAVGQHTDVMYVLRSGAVDIRDRDGELVERSESGTSFAMSPLLQETPSSYEFTAIEDSLVLAVPAEAFLGMCRELPDFKAFFDRRRRQQAQQAQFTAQIAGRRFAGLRVAARDLLARAPETADADVSIREAAQTMRDRGVSSLLVVRDGRLVGIVTDRDLRNRVLAEGRDPGDTVSTVMTVDPVTSSPDDLAFEVLMEMVARNIHHVPVVDNGHLLGVVTSTDLIRLEQANPIYLVGDLRKADSVEEVARLSARLPQVVQQLVEQDASADDVGRVATAIGDATGRRLLDLALGELGPAPVPWCWVVLGSQARHEQGLASDQDNALLLSDDVSPDDEAWFEALAQRVSDGLAACGYAYCTGGVMATNAKWRQPLRQWKRTFAGWMTTPDPDAVLAGSIFFDMRPVHGAAELFTDLQDHVLEQAPGRRTFLAHLARHAVSNHPPLGFFRGFVLEGAGEHVDTLNLKRKGLGLVVDLARVHALATGTPHVGTQSRLRAVAAAGRLSPEAAADLAGAMEFLGQVRLRHQAAQVRAGRTPDNYVSPDELSAFEKRHLRDAFQVVKQGQAVLARTYQLHYLS